MQEQELWRYDSGNEEKEKEMSTVHELEQRIKVLESVLGRGIEHLSVDEDGYLHISDMRFNTPYESGYTTDNRGNFSHSRANSGDYWNIKNYNGNDRVRIYFEDSDTRRLEFQNGTLALVNPEIDVTKANNNVSAIKYSSTSVITDANGGTLARVEGVVNPNGNVGFNIYADNYNSSGTGIGRAGIQGHVDKNGNVSYGVNSPDKFRQAIDINALIQVKYITLGSQTVAANVVKNINLTPIVNANTPAGYTFRGIVGFSTNHGSAVMVSCRPTNSQYSFEYKNTSNAQITSTPEVFALFVKSSN